MVLVSAPGNIFLFGEHAAVYGKPAIIASVDLRTTVQIDKRGDGRIMVLSDEYGSVDETIEELSAKEFNSPDDYKDPMDPVRDVIKTFLTFNPMESGMDIRIESQIPKSSGGLSSSTALFCSLFGALNFFIGHKMDGDDFFEVVLPFQKKIHGGAASGAEIISSSTGGLNKLAFNPSFQKSTIGKQEMMIVIGNTGITGLTKETVSYVRSGWESDKKSYEDIFSKIEEIVALGERALKAGDMRLVGQMMDDNHELLARELGVSHPKLNRLVDAARKAGAYGAKLSGGGKGGIMVALVDKNSHEKVKKAIELSGGVCYLTKVGVDGVRYL